MVRQARVLEPVDDEVHAEAEDHDLPGRAGQDLADGDGASAPGQGQEHGRARAGHDRHRDRKRGGDEVGDQEHAEEGERGLEHEGVADRLRRSLELRDVVGRGQVSPEVPAQDREGGHERHEVPQGP